MDPLSAARRYALKRKPRPSSAPGQGTGFNSPEYRHSLGDTHDLQLRGTSDFGLRAMAWRQPPRRKTKPKPPYTKRYTV